MNHLVISWAPVHATHSEIWLPALASKAPQAPGRPLGSSLGCHEFVLNSWIVSFDRQNFVRWARYCPLRGPADKN